MRSLLQDLRFAARQLARQKAFTAVIVATLGLAIGVNTLTFSIVNPIAFRPLPMKEVSRLVWIWSKHPENGRERTLTSYPDFVEWREQSSSFEDLAAAGERAYNLTGTDAPMRVRGYAASASLFSEWALGRRFGYGRGPLHQDVEIVGIVKDGKSISLREEQRRFVFLSHAQREVLGA